MSDIITFAVPAVEREVRRVLRKPSGDIKRAEFDAITTLSLSDNDITDVSGLTLPAGMTTLDLSGNHITDVSGLTLPEGARVYGLRR